ncbi:MAG TPA: glucose-6-phosphate dehydrogenase assembly protein OpcA [Pyrinomonadaceae bacterium]|nr:glucose-6-phosphate dehydrogenase assembly protein OpcA [Pyrinomonadaceae bacterium]
MSSVPQQIQVPNTLDVEAIERMLAELWKKTAGHNQAVGDDAVLRARAADLMVFLNDESLLSDTHQIISELASFHPCRALLMAGDRNAAARDIEMYVSAFCASQKRSDSRNLCCEEITLTAHGRFVSELPSAALPLLVPDLPVFLWWREDLGAEDRVFSQLCRAADRVVIDSADFRDPPSDFVALAQLFEHRGDEAIVLSDINWARLTPWRASLANFYDVEACRAELDQITDVRIYFVAETGKASSQALLIAGWLASRLNWKFAGATEMQRSPEGLSFHFKKNDRLIKLSLKEVQRPAMKSGRLSQIALKADDVPATFLVSRSEDGLHLETQTTVGERSYPGRLLPVRNWSAAQLLSREMEILCNDKIYEEAIEVAAEMMRHPPQDPGRGSL